MLKTNQHFFYSKYLSQFSTSPLSCDCVWISLKRLKNFEKIDACNTRIIFDNNKEIIVPCSYRTIENQVSRASRLDLIMRNRKKR